MLPCRELIRITIVVATTRGVMNVVMYRQVTHFYDNKTIEEKFSRQTKWFSLINLKLKT